MKILLYCIVSSVAPGLPATLAGVDSEPVSVVEGNGVAAAISKVEHGPDHLLTIPQVLAYEKVIELLHHQGSVIPMRYGCLFDNTQQIVRLLAERGDEYHSLLEHIGSCVEMGIRVLIDGTTECTDPESLPESNEPKSPSAPSNGCEYLATLRLKHGRGERVTQVTQHIAEQCRTVFAGLFVNLKEEHPSHPTHQSSQFEDVYSLYFLVPREAVASFRSAFQTLCLNQPEKLLLSGPWPPYNFVLPDFGK